MKTLKKGFTIVELVIVIAVIAILAGVLIPTFSGVVSKANQSGALQEATSAMKSTLAMSETGTLNSGTIFAIGTEAKITYEFIYENNQIKAVSSITTLSGIDRLIVKAANVEANKLTGLSNVQKTIITRALGITADTLAGYHAALVNNTIELRSNSEDADALYTVYVNVDYPEDLVTFVPANQ